MSEPAPPTLLPAGGTVQRPVPVRVIFAVVDRFLDDPESALSSPFGTAGLRRLRVGRRRVLYRVTDDEIQIGHIGRVPASP